MNWLTIVVFGIIIFFAWRGRQVGFIKTIFSIFSIIIALVIASAVSPHISKTLCANEKFYNYINEKVDVFTNLEKDNTEESEKQDKISVGEQVDTINQLPIPTVFKKRLIENKNNLEVYKALKVKNFKAYVSAYVTTLIINAVSFILSYLVARVILYVACSALNIISKLPVINGLNKTAGLLVGVFEGLLIVWILCIVLTIFSSTSTAQNLYLLIDDSQLLSNLYNNNLLLKGIMNITKVLF